MDFSPEAVFGGIVTAFWFYLVHTTGRAFMEWNRLLEVVQDMQTHGGTFRYLVQGLPGLTGPDIQVGHKIIVRSVPGTGKLIAFIEILGMLKTGGVFADAGGPSLLIEHIYAYDVLGQVVKSSEFSIDAAEFERQDWRSIGLSVADAEQLRDHFRQELEKVFAERYRGRFAASSARQV